MGDRLAVRLLVEGLGIRCLAGVAYGLGNWEFFDSYVGGLAGVWG